MTASPADQDGGYLHVVAAVIVDSHKRILIAKRHDHLHQGGLWEFPGGKVEAEEAVPAALSRELKEELGLEVRAARPLIRIPYSYPDRKVLLDVWRVEQFDGEARGLEEQPLRWVAAGELAGYEFPAANLPIITAARLPAAYLITPEPGPAAQWQNFLQQLHECLKRGIRLVQLRAKQLAPAQLITLAREAERLCEGMGATLLINAPAELLPQLPDECGLHLSCAELHNLSSRPLERHRWLAASCHTESDLAQAVRVGVDFVVFSPVKLTASHPGTLPIGWDGLRQFTEQSPLPVYALGGMRHEDLSLSWAHGAQGIAAIRGIWDDAKAIWE